MTQFAATLGNGYSGQPGSGVRSGPAKERSRMSAKSTDSGGLGDTIKVIIQALAIAMVVRVFLYQPFNIPSGSMKETLLIGDFIFVSKLSYGLSRFSFPRYLEMCIPLTDSCGTFRILPDMMSSGRAFGAEPKRGDVIVFKLPSDVDGDNKEQPKDYIKRLVGLPGETIETKNGVLYINGTAVPKKKIGTFENLECSPYDYNCRNVVYALNEETLPNGVKHTTLDLSPDNEADDKGPFVVPAGHYFMMGDNRDNSVDSRFNPKDKGGGVGFVPYENLVGRADVIFYSCGSDEPGRCSWFKPWAWPSDIRWSRLFNLVR
jgi:signal peptidase I